MEYKKRKIQYVVIYIILILLLLTIQTINNDIYVFFLFVLMIWIYDAIILCRLVMQISKYIKGKYGSNFIPLVKEKYHIKTNRLCTSHIEFNIVMKGYDLEDAQLKEFRKEGFFLRYLFIAEIIPLCILFVRHY